MLLRKLVVVGLVGFVSLAANIATAEDAAAPNVSFVGADGVSFIDPSEAFGDRFNLNIGAGAPGRFANLNTTSAPVRELPDYRRYEVEFVAAAPAGIDVAFAQRGGLGFNDQGELESQSRGSELRLGRGLRDMPRDRPTPAPRWYIFAASDDEALVWGPGARNAFGGASSSFALQDRAEIGDMQAGVTYEVNGLQASLAYVEREISVRSGSRSIHQDEDFAGITLTMRR